MSEQKSPQERRRERIRWIVVGFEIVTAIAMLVAIIILFGCAAAGAEENAGYVICAPGDYVNVRSGPGSKYESIGRFETGDRVTLDGKKRNGFLHCVGLSLEKSDGWIHSGYVIGSKPVSVNRNARITSNGRLAARKNVNGKRTRWLKPDAIVTVYVWSDEWCVTNCGYIQSQYLEPEV